MSLSIGSVDMQTVSVMEPKAIGIRDSAKDLYITSEPWIVALHHHFLLLPSNVGVTETMPIRNRVAKDWKSYRSPIDCNSPRAIPACTKPYVRKLAFQVHLFSKCIDTF